MINHVTGVIEEENAKNSNLSITFSRLKNQSLKRPETPHINLFSTKLEDDVQVRNMKKGNDAENLIKNFSSFMKQIIETKNEFFLSGDTKVIEFIMTKYLNMDLEEINNLEKLSIKINTDFGLLNQFGDYLPKLKELKLNNSVINSISEIGTSFRQLIILNISNCGLKDLSGIICFSNLETLEASDNSISDLIELEMCSSIKKLNLKNNLIDEEENIEFLSNLSDLKWLNLIDNPIRKHDRYENLIIALNLEVIDKDDEPIANDFLYEDKRFRETNSTFSSSPSYSNTNNTQLMQNNYNHPISAYTSTKFFKSNSKLQIAEEENEEELYQEIITKHKLNQSFSPSKKDTSEYKPWNLPENHIFDFSHTVRGKSSHQTNSTCDTDNPLTLRPVVLKKGKKPFGNFDMSNTKSKEDEKIANEIIKNLDRNQGKMFKINHFNNNGSTTSRLSEKVGTLKKFTVPVNSKEVKPLKLKVLNKTLGSLNSKTDN